MYDMRERTWSKVPEVTLTFWIIKIAATTLGETGGDTVTMTLNWGYLGRHRAVPVGVAGGARLIQTAAKKFHPFLYWATIVASTTSRYDDGRFCRPFAWDRLHRRFGAVVACLLATLGLGIGRWARFRSDTVNRPKVEASIGPRLRSRRRSVPRWRLDGRSRGLGYEGGALVFAAALALVAALITGRCYRGCCCSGRPSF